MNKEWNKSLEEKIEILKRIKDTHTLRKLFVEGLNYEYADHEVIIDYPESVKGDVCSTKIISEKGEFKVIFCTIDRLLKGTELPVVKSISKKYFFNLIVFTDKNNNEFHFINTRYVGREEKQVRGFRRITVGKIERLRTAAERLSKIFASEGISPLALMVKCEEAFNVEAVTEAFYKEFVRRYKDFRKVIRKERKLSDDTADWLT